MKRLMFLFLFCSNQSWALDSPNLVFENNRGAKNLEENNAVGAQNDISKAMKNNPDNAVLNLNLGLSFAKQGLIEKAEQSWKIAAKVARNSEERFYALYNLGAINQAAKKNDQALNYYEQALAEKPNSKETKLNIEILLNKNQQEQKGKGDGSGNEQDENKPKDPNEGEEENKEKKEKEEKEGKQYAKNPKPQPKPFKSEQLDQGDVNKILGELKQQEQRIRGEFHKTDQQESPNEKDW
jgi:tetratricopeptide (TPR) repeat protein